jgi:hypothetical protein
MRRGTVGLVAMLVVAACGGGGAVAEQQQAPPPEVGSPPPASSSTAPTPSSSSTTPPAPTSTGPKPPDPPLTASTCFAAEKGAVTGPDYDQYKPTIVKSCSGTHHQTIPVSTLEKVVFLGDSITVGTPPTLPEDFYSIRLYNALKKKSPSIAMASCAGWGAQTNDLLDNDKQLEKCFPNASEPAKTLIVMTMGGNDIAGWAKGQISAADAMTNADQTIANLRAAIDWVHAPGRFPNGVWFVFGNVYEYTDTSGDLSSCPAASLSGFKGNWAQGAPAIVHLQEGYMKAAVETGTDMMFLLEHFCGHGYKRDDPTLQCYRGPGTPLWFDLTCYHPNPTGHGQISDLFMNVIEGI